MGSKKGFTLAEILIVLMIMGILVLITIPVLFANIEKARLKAAYKRAYNIINATVNIHIAKGSLADAVTTDSAEEATRAIYDIFTNTSSFKEHYDETTRETLFELPEDADLSTIWANTEDGFSYKIECDPKNATSRKSTLSTLSTYEELKASSLCIITVDLNGHNKKPNSTDPKTELGLEEDEAFDDLSYDRYPIFIALDGTSAGHRTKTITGRIMGETGY